MKKLDPKVVFKKNRFNPNIYRDKIIDKLKLEFLETIDKYIVDEMIMAAKETKYEMSPFLKDYI